MKPIQGYTLIKPADPMHLPQEGGGADWGRKFENNFMVQISYELLQKND
jgi:hypothetical protein